MALVIEPIYLRYLVLVELQWNKTHGRSLTLPKEYLNIIVPDSYLVF